MWESYNVTTAINSLQSTWHNECSAVMTGAVASQWISSSARFLIHKAFSKPLLSLQYGVFLQFNCRVSNEKTTERSIKNSKLWEHGRKRPRSLHALKQSTITSTHIRSDSSITITLLLLSVVTYLNNQRNSENMDVNLFITPKYNHDVKQ
jgi:hypothetical protein